MSKFKYNLAVIGLGYVGLPLAIEAANNKLKVAGYDINESIVDSLNKSISHVEDITDNVLQDALSKDFLITSDSSVLGESEFIVISVPTPLTDYQPDLSYVEAATKSIAKNLTKSQIIILESTTYPGTTLEVVKPILEKNNIELSNIILIDPLSYIDFMSLVYGCDLVLTDSGGIQEETTYLGINCLTLREETERPITVQEGTNKVIGTDKENIINEINNVLGSKISNEAKIKYWDGKTSERIYEILFG